MPETFLILLAAGIMLAAAAPNPFHVTLHWLRLAGILALSMTGLSLYFLLTRDVRADTPIFFQRLQIGQAIVTAGLILAQLAFAQTGWRRAQRAAALGAFVVGVLAGSAMLHDMMIVRGSAMNFPPKSLAMLLQTLASAGIAALCGLALMDMLLGHAYLTASRMTIEPFARLNGALEAVMIGRGMLSVGGAIVLHIWRPVPMLWGVYGLYIITRWAVGIVVAGIFIYMADDCIRRRSTQSATGILYVAGVLIFIGEIIALYLVRETGLPF
jgi:hypothetical protein